MAAPKAPPKGGGVLKAKIGPVPVPLIIFAVVGVGVYLYFHNRAATAPTSAGSNATPDATTAYPPTDSTGGGSSGGVDLSSLIGDLFGLLSTQQASLQTALEGTNMGLSNQAQAATVTPTASPSAAQPASYNYGAGTSTGGGNVSPPAISTPSQPDTSFYDNVKYIEPEFAGGGAAAPITTGDVGPQYNYTSSNPSTSGPTAGISNLFSSPAAAIKYYTYKKDVPLNGGQTLHFTTGKGYYAA